MRKQSFIRVSGYFTAFRRPTQEQSVVVHVVALATYPQIMVRRVAIVIFFPVPSTYLPTSLIRTPRVSS